MTVKCVVLINHREGGRNDKVKMGDCMGGNTEK